MASGHTGSEGTRNGKDGEGDRITQKSDFSSQAACLLRGVAEEYDLAIVIVSPLRAKLWGHNVELILTKEFGSNCIGFTIGQSSTGAYYSVSEISAWAGVPEPVAVAHTEHDEKAILKLVGHFLHANCHRLLAGDSSAFKDLAVAASLHNAKYSRSMDFESAKVQAGMAARRRNFRMVVALLEEWERDLDPAYLSLLSEARRNLGADKG